MSTVKSSSENLTLNADGANSDVIIQNNGTEAVRVDSTGNVGIGTTSPSTELEVDGTVTTDNLTIDNGLADGGNAVFKSSGNSDWNVDNTGVLRVYSGSTVHSFSTSGLTVTGTLNATTVDLGNWTITESSGVLYFATGGTNKMKLDASGNLTVVGDVTAFGTV